MLMHGRLLPIAAVITPAAISVITSQEITNALGTPRQLYFDPNHYSSLQTLVRSDYVGPLPDTLRTAYGSAMTGQILPIPAAHPNMSYNLDFIGPALRCDHADASVIHDVYEAYVDQVTVESQYYYIAWVPRARNRFQIITDVTDSTGSWSLDVESTDAAHLYIIPNTTISGPIFVGGIQKSLGAYCAFRIPRPLGMQIVQCLVPSVLLNFSFPSSND